MLANKLINDIVLPLRTSDTGKTALNWMEELRISHLPIVNNESFLGLIAEKDIYDHNDFDDPLGNYQLSLARPYVFSDQHLFDIIKLLGTLKLSLVPVLDESENYLGCITQSRILEQIAEKGSFNQPGGIVVLEVNTIDYSLHEIARIVESNDSKILSCITHTDQNSTKTEISLKFNKIDISAIIQTFNRFGYHIIASFSDENNYDDMLKERFDSLMNYLSI